MTETREFRRLGPYLLVRTSGTGGMGRVELALRSDDPAGAACVIKRMHADSRSDEARFRREAQIAARLDNENIARTFRVEDIDGELCLAQEFVEGIDLGRMMRQCRPRALPVPVAVHVIREVCRGLGYAHDFGGHGIVHRDVTPENIMVSFSGDVKLIDFGIARSAVDGTLTSVGVVVGRREYIAPEAWEGEKLDRRADVYSLGVVLWELLTGLRLEGSSEIGPGKRPPNPCSVNAAIPDGLGEIVSRALAAAPSDRFESAEALSSALAPFVPLEPHPKDELVTLLRLHVQVDLLRELLATDVAEARRVLRPELPPSVPARSNWGGIAIAAGVAAIVLVAGVKLLARPREKTPTIPQPAIVKALPTPVAAPEVSPPAPPQHSEMRVVTLPAEGRASVAGRGERHVRREMASAQSNAAKASPPPPSGEDLVRQAQTEWDRGNDGAALALLRQARKTKEGSSARVLAGAILIGEEKLPAAERELVEALRLDPENARAKGLLAMAREKMERR
jgi:hypothetical protein